MILVWIQCIKLSTLKVLLIYSLNTKGDARDHKSGHPVCRDHHQQPMGRGFTDEIAARTQVVKDEAAHTWTEETY